MRAKARLLGHPVHPMLVVFPLGLLPVSFLFDLVALGAGSPSWYRVTFWMIPSYSRYGVARRSRPQPRRASAATTDEAC